MRRWLAHPLVPIVLLGLILGIRYPLKFARETPFHMDFEVYHFTASLVRAGEAPTLYRKAYEATMPFKYGPPWALLMAPLAWLPRHAGTVLWCTLSLLWLLLTARAARALLDDAGHPQPWWVPLVAALLIARPLAEEFGNGQCNLWWAGLIVLSLVGQRRGRPWLAALSLSLAILLKLPALLALPWLLFTGQRPLAGRTLACLAALLAASGLALTPAQPWLLPLEWGRCLAATTEEVSLRIGDQSLRAFFARWLMDDGYHLNAFSFHRATVTLIAWLAAAGLCVAALPRRRAAASPAGQLTDTALLLTLIVLASPAAWVSTYTLLFFPLLVALTLLEARGRVAGQRLPAALAGAVLGLANSFTHKWAWKLIGLRQWRGEAYLYQVFMILPGFALLLLGALCWLHPDRRAAPGTSGS